MNETYDLWSAPWHALQRSLANGSAGEAAVGAAAHPQPGARGAAIGAAAHRQPRARGAAPAAVSWLMRARHHAAQTRR